MSRQKDPVEGILARTVLGWRKFPRVALPDKSPSKTSWLKLAEF